MLHLFTLTTPEPAAEKPELFDLDLNVPPIGRQRIHLEGNFTIVSFSWLATAFLAGALFAAAVWTWLTFRPM